MYTSRLRRHSVVDNNYRKRRVPVEQFRHDALVVRRKMLDDDEDILNVLRQMAEESLKSLQASGRGAETDDAGDIPGCIHERHVVFLREEIIISHDISH